MGQDSLQGWPCVHRSPRGRDDEWDPEKHAFKGGRLRRGIFKHLSDTGAVCQLTPISDVSASLNVGPPERLSRRRSSNIWHTSTTIPLRPIRAYLYLTSKNAYHPRLRWNCRWQTTVAFKFATDPSHCQTDGRRFLRMYVSHFALFHARLTRSPQHEAA